MFIVWMPLIGVVGLIFAVPGLLFGLMSLTLCAFRRLHGIRLAAFGAATCALSIVVFYMVYHSKGVLWHVLDLFIKR